MPTGSTGVQTAGAQQPNGTPTVPSPACSGVPPPPTGTEQGSLAPLGRQNQDSVGTIPSLVTGSSSARAGSREGRFQGSSGRGAPAWEPLEDGGVKGALWSVSTTTWLGGPPPGCRHPREQGEAYLRASRGGRWPAGAGGLRAVGSQLSDPPSRGEMPQPALGASFYPQSVIAASSRRGKEGGREGGREKGEAWGRGPRGGGQ